MLKIEITPLALRIGTDFPLNFRKQRGLVGKHVMI